MPDTRNDEMTLKDLLVLLWGNRWILVACIVLGGAVALLIAQSSLPEYKVDALLQIETKSGKAGANPLGAMADMFEVTNPAETEIEVIKSRLVLGRAAEVLRLDLQIAPLTWGRWSRLCKVPKPELTLERLDVPPSLLNEPLELELLGHGNYLLRHKERGEILRGKVGIGLDSASNLQRVGIFVTGAKAKVGDKFVVSRTQILSGIAALRANLTVEEVGKKTGIIGISFTGYDPVRNATILNAVANAYLRQDVEQKSAEAEKTLSFLQEQLPEIKKSLEASEVKLNQYRSTMGSVDLSEEAKLALSQQVEVQQKLFETKQKRKELEQLFKEDHPNILTMDSTIASLTGKLGRQEQQVKALPLQQQEVVRLMRDVQVNTELYTGLLNNSQQLKVVKAGEIGNVRIIDSAVPVFTPVKPQKPKILGAGLGLGLLLGCGIILLRRLLQTGVDDPKVIEKELGLPVYANVPHSQEQEKLHSKIKRKEKGTHLLAIKAPDDLAVESFRSLRTTLHFSMLDATNKVLLLVGPSPAIGKSFVSANFAATLAMTGSKVLLVDGDLRRGHIHQFFGTARGTGLSDILSGCATLAEAVISTEVLGLSLLSTGTIPPNPSELLLHENFVRLLGELAPLYDYLVIDSPPVLAVTDAVILGKLAGTTLMVLKQGQHPMSEIEACQKRLSQAAVTLKGVVFNDVNLSQRGSRYGAYLYQYAYRPQGK